MEAAYCFKIPYIVNAQKTTIWKSLLGKYKNLESTYNSHPSFAAVSVTRKYAFIFVELWHTRLRLKLHKEYYPSVYTLINSKNAPKFLNLFISDVLFSCIIACSTSLYRLTSFNRDTILQIWGLFWKERVKLRKCLHNRRWSKDSHCRKSP
jgi:hypothetical protein